MDKISKSAMRVELEVPCIKNSIKNGKTILNFILDGGYNLANIKINIK